MRPKHIGIVSCSYEGASLCYRTICGEGSQFLGEHDHPQVTMYGAPLAAYMELIYRDDWQGVGELMLQSAAQLAKIGADLLICPDNTIHQAFPFIEGRSPLPWLHIAEVVAETAAQRGYRKLGLTGTRYLVESEVYPSRLSPRGIDFVRPDAGQRNEINRIIFEELVYGDFKPQSVAYVQQVITALAAQGCDAVVLGCTEIPLIINETNSALPVLDSTRLLARAALRRAIE
jgi:aspartate racemase